MFLRYDRFQISLHRYYLMNYWYSLTNGLLLIGSIFLVPVTSSAILLLKENTAIAEQKPLEPGVILDKPLPDEDLPVKPPIGNEPINRGCLSDSQVRIMKDMLQESKDKAIKGNLQDAMGAFDEFVGGAWEQVSETVRIAAPNKYQDITASIKKIDGIVAQTRRAPRINRKSTRLKFIKEITNLIAIIAKVGGKNSCV
jgi:hypothetical protein